jgi:hypothetical protein
MALPVERPVPPFEQLRRVPKSFRLQIRTSVAWAASIALALGLGYYLHDSATRAAPSGSLDAGTIVAAAPPQEKPRRSMSQKSGERNRRKPSPDALALREAPRAAPPSNAVAGASAPLRDSIAASFTEVPPTMRAQMQRQDALSESKMAANTWPRIDRQTAKTLLGEDPVGLPDLTTRSYRRSPDQAGVVVVEQELDNRTVIQIFQQQAAPASARGRADRLARFVGQLRVEIGGPVSVDSLNRLLEQVGRLP